jgi:hypothetical protein
VDFDPGDLAAEPCQRIGDGTADPFAHGLGAFNVVIGVNLDLHFLLLVIQPLWLKFMIVTWIRENLTSIN